MKSNETSANDIATITMGCPEPTDFTPHARRGRRRNPIYAAAAAECKVINDRAKAECESIMAKAKEIIRTTTPDLALSVAERKEKAELRKQKKAERLREKIKAMNEKLAKIFTPTVETPTVDTVMTNAERAAKIEEMRKNAYGK